MFHHIRGKLCGLTSTRAVVETGGVGYELTISLSTHRKLLLCQGECMLFAHFAVSENAQTLYGFAEEHERALFRLLIDVNGIGPSTATQILSGCTPQDFAQAVERQDVGTLKKIKGIGDKTAKRIVLELKGKIDVSAFGARLGTASEAPASDSAQAARRALETLGLTPREAAARVDKVLCANPDLPLEEIIRLSLQ